MSVLEKIRSKTGLLVGIVGLALVIFILESLLGSGGALFSGQDLNVGEIAGDKIDYPAFSAKVNEQIAQIQKQNPNPTAFRCIMECRNFDLNESSICFS